MIIDGTGGAAPVTMGSLFDGIGAAPLAASYYGIKTLWASEILSAAISVTKRHFPEMEHLGDVRNVNGAKIPPVDIIVAGTPCQDISISNSMRLGLSGERSGLFFEAIRIIREMRDATDGRFPRFYLWENVAHALGVNSGRDFQTILSEITQADIPMPLHGKWAHAGMVLFDGKSVAWRLLDSQFWATGQRRVRCFLVADYRGRSAGEICFKPAGMYGYLTPGGTPWERLAAAAKGGSYGNRGENNGVAAGFMAGQAANSRSIAYNETVAPTLKSSPSGSNTMPCLLCSAGESQVARTLTARGDSSPCADRGQNIIITSLPRNKSNCITPWAAQGGRIFTKNGVSPTLAGVDMAGGRNVGGLIMTESSNAVFPEVTGTLCASGAGLSRTAGNANETDLCVVQNVSAVDCRNLSENTGVCGTLQSKVTGGHSLNYQSPVRYGYIVRRLMPEEAEKLMALPPGWTAYGHDGKALSDSRRYSLCGNSIVVTCLAYFMAGITEQMIAERGDGNSHDGNNSQTTLQGRNSH